MTPVEAANLIGLTPGQIRHLIRQGRINATRVSIPGKRLGIDMFAYSITMQEIRRFMKLPIPTVGRKRGPRK